MCDSESSDIAAEESAIISASNASYEQDIKQYINNGRAFCEFSDESLADAWLEIALSQQTSDDSAAMLRVALEAEHLLRGSALPYDRLIEAGGQACDMSKLPSAATLGLALGSNYSEFEQSIEKRLAGLRKRHLTRQKN